MLLFPASWAGGESVVAVRAEVAKEVRTRKQTCNKMFSCREEDTCELVGMSRGDESGVFLSALFIFLILSTPASCNTRCS